MAEEIRISNVSARGLVSKQYICVEASCYDIEADPRILIPFTQDGKYGLMDKARNIVLDAKYDIIIDSAYATDDLIRVGVYHYVNFGKTTPKIYRRSTVGVININGEFVIPMEYKSIALPHKSSLFSVEKKNSDGHGVVDIDNNIIVPFGKYTDIDGYTRGYARVKNEDGKWGIIDESGEEVVPCIYPYIKSFYDFYRTDYTAAKVMTENHQLIFDLESGKFLSDPANKTSKGSDQSVDIIDDYGCHYGEFEGTYAQDVAGYDDDTINDAFEGDPDAYWNID